MAKFKFQVILTGEVEAPNREGLQAMLSTGVSYSLAVGSLIGDVQVNVAAVSKVLSLHEQ